METKRQAYAALITAYILGVTAIAMILLVVLLQDRCKPMTKPNLQETGTAFKYQLKKNTAINNFINQVKNK